MSLVRGALEPWKTSQGGEGRVGWKDNKEARRTPKSASFTIHDRVWEGDLISHYRLPHISAKLTHLWYKNDNNIQPLLEFDEGMWRHQREEIFLKHPLNIGAQPAYHRHFTKGTLLFHKIWNEVTPTGKQLRGLEKQKEWKLILHQKAGLCSWKCASSHFQVDQLKWTEQDYSAA